MPTLLWLFLTPLVTSLIAIVVPIISGKFFKRFAVVLSLIPLGILLFSGYNIIGSEINYPWFPTISINFHLTVDSLSLLFLYLTAIIVPISILSVRSYELTQPNFFYGIVLLLQAILIGFFTARDLAVFTIFWEAMLIPLYFMIALWGGPKRVAAAIKFIIYMIAGSSLLIAAVLALYFTSSTGNAIGTFNIDALAKFSEGSAYAPWIFAIFLLAFAVKTPLFPFHAWLPDAYCQASTPGTILLSAILSKAGIYGIVRIGLGLFPTLMQEWSPALLGLAIAGVFYGGFAAWRQNDFKRLLAYSSFSHVNFILVGLFVWNETAHSGAILQALNHGITIAALFLVAGWLEERLRTTQMGHNRGLAKYFPQLCWLTLFFVLSSVALPGTNNFVGELLILLGLFKQQPWVSSFLALTVILSVIYMLRLMQKVYFETPTAYQDSWVDIRGKELIIAMPLVALILWVGIYPSPILKQIQPTNAKTFAVAQLEENS